MNHFNILSDIRFWLIISFVIRLYGITNPPIEVTHNWRQTTVTMVARNFLEIDSNILYPRIDIAGEKTGITGMEFPFFNYLIYLLSLLFGYSHWYGRLINLVISCIGMFFYYKILKKYFSEKIAFYATLVLVFSLWFPYSRKIMPDTFSMSLVIIGFYHGTNYFDTGKKLKDLLLYTIFVLVGILSKIPSGFILILFLPLLINRSVLLQTKIRFVIANLIIASIVFIWYGYWVPRLVEEFGFKHFFMGKSFIEGISEIIASPGPTLNRFFDNALKYIGFGLFAVGLGISFYKKQRRLSLVFLLGFLGFLIIVLKAGNTFIGHDYYMVPFVPLMTIYCGYSLTLIKRKGIVTFILIAVALECTINYHYDFRNNRNTELLSLEKDFDSFSSREDLIIINSGVYPTPMYFTHRKGWVETNEKISNKNFIAELKEKDLAYILILKKGMGTYLALDYPVVFENDNYIVHKP